MYYLNYLKRIIPAYLLRLNSQLTFWHENPQINLNAFRQENRNLYEYYMTFYEKANYPGPFDENNIPLLNYHGNIGKQYNPIAIAQYGLGNINLYKKTKKIHYYNRFLNSANWLSNNLKKNKFGVYFWAHEFDWEYFGILKAPWYSALAQGQGVSLLLRTYLETKLDKYLENASKAFEALIIEKKNGGVLYVDNNGYWWLEEYLVYPPSHVLNGFIWALWGVYDYYIVTKEHKALKLYENCLQTLIKHLCRYDTGFWSLYDLSDNFLKSISSFFYHDLHIVQLKIMYEITKLEVFMKYAKNWEMYRKNKINLLKAIIYKSAFKLIYY